MASRETGLSKSKYLAGLQCPRRLWLQCHAPDLRGEIDAGALSRIAMGNEVGERARRLFPGGLLVSEEPRQHGEAIRRTREILQQRDVPAIFEAAFEHRGVRIRVDALERLPDGGFGLREVKASGSVKPHHLDDIAIQRFVLGGAGIAVGSVELIHVNQDYVRGEAGIHWPSFFTRQECTERVEKRLPEVSSSIARMHALLAEDAAPEVEPGPHCREPVGCDFWEHCTAGKPVDWIHHLPNLRRWQREALRESGQERISLLRADLPLTSFQIRARDAVRSGRPFVSEALADALRPIAPPVWYLDFETINPAIPPYAGTRPFETIPFQWSLHRLEPGGQLTHQEFLAAGPANPRRACAEKLIDALSGDAAPVVVYSRFEQTQIAGLIRALPDLEAPLLHAIERLVDLYEIVRAHVYHPGFGGSISIKAVAPALCAGFGYDDLDEIAEGAVAAASFLRIARGKLGPDEERRTRAALRAYCGHDTLAMVEVHAALRELAGC
jgi:hypothetical protein